MSGISSSMAGVASSWAAALAPADAARATPAAAGEALAAAHWFDAPDAAGAQLLRAPADQRQEAPHTLAQRFLGCLLAGDGG